MFCTQIFLNFQQARHLLGDIGKNARVCWLETLEESQNDDLLRAKLICKAVAKYGIVPKVNHHQAPHP